MKKICLLLIFCSGTIYSFSQVSPQQSEDSISHHVDGIAIRGVPALSGPDPLIIIDGVMKGTYTANSCDIDPSTITEVGVLRDSAAVAKYGDTAKDGVIIIVTKQVKSE